MIKIRQGLSAVALGILTLCLATSSVAAQRSGRSGGRSSTSRSSTSRSSTSSAPKTVHVKGYTRSDGTYVPAYDRAAPGTSSSTTGSLYGETSTSSAVPRDENGRIVRSRAARSAFERMHPCPATGGTSGSCPGYVVDHIIPLANGGPDDPSNMQWQTVEEAKAKDKWERNGGTYTNLFPPTTPAHVYTAPSQNRSGDAHREPTVSAPPSASPSDLFESYYEKLDRESRIRAAADLQRLGYDVKWQDHTWSEMVDWESRIRAATDLQRLGYDVKWQDHTWSEMVDWESRIRAATDLQRLGYDVKWQDHTWSEMVDWESRIRQANVLRSRGIEVDWTKYTYWQLLEMVQRRP